MKTALSLHPSLFEALAFAAQLHQYQRRSGYNQLPYINHLIKVTNTLIQIGKEKDTDLLLASILHDAIEDTEADEQTLTARFGNAVTSIVLELTDDMDLPYPERKLLQLQNAHTLSLPARKIRIADKACNIEDIFSYPLNWTEERKSEYVKNSVQIVDQIRGTSATLEVHFDKIVAWSRTQAGV